MSSLPTKPNREQEEREKRRSEQLRANLARRKQQSRSRRSGAADDRDEGLKAATTQIDTADSEE
jgi:hypothetical protein